MKRSEKIGALVSAMAKAQAVMEGAKKDAANPFFKSHYASLAGVIEVVRKPFATNGIAWMQFPRATEDGVEVETVFAVQTEAGDEWVSEVLSLPVAKNDAQGVGSAISYAKRYALQAMAGIPSEDDDGNKAVASVQENFNLRDKTFPKLEVAAQTSLAALEKAWKGLSAPERSACQKDLEGLKKHAATSGNA